MKLMITMEVEFSDLPEEVREELADGLNFRSEDDELNDDLDTVPTVAEMEPDEIVGAVTEFFESFDDYEIQAEVWAGSDVYGYLSSISVKSVEAA